jgi:hypothetical protein
VTRTSPVSLILFAVFGAAGGWLVEVALIASGRAATVPPVTLALALAVIGGLDIVLAVPIRRAMKTGERGRINPFYAARVAVLAKASSLAGALIAGAAFGILAFLLTRSVIAGVGSIAMAVATAVGAIVLLVAGLVAEYLCSVPPEDGDTPDKSGPAEVRPH